MSVDLLISCALYARYILREARHVCRPPCLVRPLPQLEFVYQTPYPGTSYNSRGPRCLSISFLRVPSTPFQPNPLTINREAQYVWRPSHRVRSKIPGPKQVTYALVLIEVRFPPYYSAL